MNLDPDLLAHAQRLLDRARVLAEAPAGQLAPTGHAKPSSHAPTGDPSLLDRIGAELNAARSDRELLAALTWAEREIRSVTHSSGHTPETPEEFRTRVIADHQGSPAQYVADREHVSLTLIRRIRQEAGRDPRTGRTPGQ